MRSNLLVASMIGVAFAMSAGCAMAAYGAFALDDADPSAVSRLVRVPFDAVAENNEAGPKSTVPEPKSPTQGTFGAFAYDEVARKYGWSWNRPNARSAEEAAIKGCASEKCAVVFHTGPRECGAIAMTPDDKIWGGASRQRIDAAKLAAIENCQKRTSGQCKVRASECNR